MCGCVIVVLSVSPLTLTHTRQQRTGQVDSFQDMLDNIFLPLFQVTIDPSTNPPLHYFLELVQQPHNTPPPMLL